MSGRMKGLHMTKMTIQKIIRGIPSVLLYGLSMALLIFVVKWLQLRFLIVDHSIELYIGLIALLFTLLGIWVATQLTRRKTIPVSSVQSVEDRSIDKRMLSELELTNREYEVLLLLVKGHSNSEIADKLCLSVSTIKTHVSNLFVKLDVKSRTQVIEKAIRLRIVP